ncbi:hypothetical protein SFC02_10755 [Terribacillus goriensis]|uniref:hypothetical protein n=1 Tax=Terribacillus saccharophilus TaxID=361277 RepID=UPI0039836E4E
MRNNIFAIYHGKEYAAGIKADGKIILRSEDSQAEQFGFENKTIADNTIYVKYVHQNDIEQIYKKQIEAIYKGYKFEVVETKGDMISIVTMTGDYKIWEKLSMNLIDKGIYQKWINKDDAIINEIKNIILM